MSSYFDLARGYDALTKDVDYSLWADFYETVYKVENVKVESILDLACGTGTLSYILAGRGYDVIAVDISPEMLSIAFNKECDGERPMFLNQDMRNLDLYGTVDSVVCCLDGINYLTDPSDALKTFGRIKHFINPGGLLIFDINSPSKLRKMDGGMYVDETEDVFCVWRSEFDEIVNKCRIGYDIFERVDGGLWQRSFEEHEEYAYRPEELSGMLIASEFEDIKVYGDKSMEPPGEGEQRIFITSKRKHYTLENN